VSLSVEVLYLSTNSKLTCIVTCFMLSSRVLFIAYHLSISLFVALLSVIFVMHCFVFPVFNLR